jgi:hypothetical protein
MTGTARTRIDAPAFDAQRTFEAAGPPTIAYH